MNIPQMGVYLEADESAVGKKEKASIKTYDRGTWVGRRPQEICLEEGQPS